MKIMNKVIYETNKIAILMATYNGEYYIRQQIESILKQTNEDWNLYIHDDGSTDNTVNIIKSYTFKYPKKIFMVEGPRTGGAKYNFFYLMRSVKAPYYMFSDQDDVWMSNKVQITFERMKRDTEEYAGKPLLVFSDLRVVDENLHVISKKMSNYQKLNMFSTDIYHLMIQNVVTGCTCMINHKCKELSLKCKNMEEVVMHDWWCGLVASYFGKVDYLDITLIDYRQHTDNTIGAKNVHSLCYIMHRIRDCNEIKKSIANSQKQIKCFDQTFGVSDEGLQEFSNLSNLSKIKKIQLLFKYHIWKSGLIRNIGLMIYC